MQADGGSSVVYLGVSNEIHGPSAAVSAVSAASALPPGHSQYVTQHLASTLAPGEPQMVSGGQPGVHVVEPMAIHQSHMESQPHPIAHSAMHLEDPSVSMATSIANSLHGNSTTPSPAVASREPTPIQRMSPTPNSSPRLVEMHGRTTPQEQTEQREHTPIPSPVLMSSGPPTSNHSLAEPMKYSSLISSQ